MLLDEVADLNADARARPLRFRNDWRFERLGEVSERKADVPLATRCEMTFAITSSCWDD